jgi:Fe-S cluster biosynthesis and repair protein YggX
MNSAGAASEEIPLAHHLVLFAGLLLCLASCVAGEDKPAQPASMTDDQFDAFVNAANDELQQKQDHLINELHLGSFARWHYDQETEKLQFFDEKDRLRLEADSIAIGTYSPVSMTWMWAWANESNLPALRQKAEKLKELEAITGLDTFGMEGSFQVEDEEMAWTMVAVSIKHLGALGGYRAPSSREGGPTSFLALMAIRTFPEAAP